MDSFGVYVHVPYCRTICPYCNFNVYARKSRPWKPLANAIVQELHLRAPLFREQPMGSIYFGGGTPSLAPDSFFETIISSLREEFRAATDIEITIEANPGTIAHKALPRWRNLGMNRLSLGWQSTQPALMKTLGRDHTVEESTAAFHEARRAGFDNISVDLIFGVPGQRASHLAADLEALVALKPDHVSIYELTFHEGTPYAHYLKNGRLQALDDDRLLAMTLQIEEAMSATGFEHYEVSNFGQPGKRSRHNQRYWTGSPFLGLGPGAHSFHHENWRKGHRWESRRVPEKYMEAMATGARALPVKGDAGVEFVDTLSSRQLLNERIMTSVRLENGVAMEQLNLAGLELEFNAARADAISRGWLENDASRLVATTLGRRHADALAALFF